MLLAKVNFNIHIAWADCIEYFCSLFNVLNV